MELYEVRAYYFPIKSLCLSLLGQHSLAPDGDAGSDLFASLRELKQA